MAKCSKCCKKKACCNKLCVPVWIVILTGIALAVCLPLLDCPAYFDLSFYLYGNAILFWIAVGTISAEVVFAIVFLILIKCGAKCGCCGIIKNIWLILHLVLLSVLAYLIFDAPRPKADDLCEILTVEGKLSSCNRANGGSGINVPEYIVEMQESKNCCGIYDYKDYGDPPTDKILTCPEGSFIHLGPPLQFGNKTSPSKINIGILTTTTTSTLNIKVTNNLTTSAPNISRPAAPANPEPVIPLPLSGCLYKLEAIYEKCIVSTYRYVLIMLVLGVIPYVCFTLAWRQAMKDEENINDDEGEDVDEENANNNNATNAGQAQTAASNQPVAATPQPNSTERAQPGTSAKARKSEPDPAAKPEKDSVNPQSTSSTFAPKPDASSKEVPTDSTDSKDASR